MNSVNSSLHVSLHYLLLPPPLLSNSCFTELESLWLSYCRTLHCNSDIIRYGTKMIIYMLRANPNHNLDLNCDMNRFSDSISTRMISYEPVRVDLQFH